MLGAERFGFGTLPLLALGCKMVRQCHLNTCPVGIATQREDLRAKFTGAADHVVILFRHLAEEVRHLLAALGVRSVAELIGRADWLRPGNHPLAAGLSSLLVRAEGRHRHPGYAKAVPSRLNDRLVSESANVLDNGGSIELSFPITNSDRTVGARLAGEIVSRGLDPLPAGTIKVHLAGVAGQSFGAFLVDGIDLRLRGTANDYVGKGMGGGLVTVVPRRPNELVPHAAGNAVLYGATGGRAFLAGTVGQRFAVRNSGAMAVVEGCSDHGCEYMTGGMVVVLGPVGRNFAAGMTGGVAYVWDPRGLFNRYIADTSPAMRRPLEAEGLDLHDLLRAYVAETGSPVGSGILDHWLAQVNRFWVLRASRPAETPVPVSVGTGRAT
jgi:glutamate synthase domain-containing protein 3